MPDYRSLLRTVALPFGVALVLGFAGDAMAQPSVTLVPGTVNAGGLNGTRFVSDLALTNPSSLPVTATLMLIPANGTTPAFATLNPGETVVYRNVLDSLWGAQGAGATQIIGTGPLLIRARTYNTAASGTYGVALPVFAVDRVFSAGDSAQSLWISQSASGSTGYRTNVAVVFPDAAGGAATVSVYDADGNLAGTQEFALGEPGFQQFGVGSFAGAVPVGRAEIRVSGGRAVAYSVVVDNVTGDSSLFSFEALPAGTQDVLVNGVARANGRNDTFFRTDGRFYNPGSSDATVSVAFHASQDSNSSPVTRTFTVPAGKIRDVVDVLDSLLGLPIGSAGALRFTSEARVAILCRTSNVDPLGVKPGTFGAQQKPTPLLSFLMSADPGAVITGIRQNATFRTNVGFAAGAAGASYSLTLKDASGATVASTTRSLGTFGWAQPNVADLFPGTPIPDDATLLVRVTSGSVDVFDSSIDNASGDPVVSPIMPLPAEIPSAATIGPAGGSVRSSDGRLTLKVPAGALSQPAAISFVSASSDAPNGSGAAYVLTAPQEVEGKALLVLSYFPDDLAGSGAGALSLAARGGDGWYIMHGGSIDAASRTLVLPLQSISPPSGPSARVAADSTRAITMAILKAWKIVPEKVVVRTSGKATFKAYYAGPPTTKYSPFDPNRGFYEKASDPNVVTVTWIAEQGDGVTYGTLASSQTSATYTAPCQAPPVNPIRVRFVVSDPRLVDTTSAFDNPALVYILPRKWVAEMDIATSRCGISGGGFYTYKNASINFSLDDNLSVIDVVSGDAIAPKIDLMTRCDGGDTCSYLPGPAPAPKLQISDALGRNLQSSYGEPDFSIMVRVPLIPEVTELCPSGDRVIPGQGQSQPIEFSVAIPHAPNFSSTDPFGNVGVTTRLRALPDDACP